MTKQFDFGEPVKSIAISARGDLVYTGLGSDGLRIIKTATEVVRRPFTMGGPVLGAALTRDSRWCYLAMGEFGLKRLDTITEQVEQLRNDGVAADVAMSTDGRYAYVNYGGGGPGGTRDHGAVGRFDASTGAYVDSITGLPNTGGSFAMSPSGDGLLVGSYDACSRQDYDHTGCPTVPGHVLHWIDVRAWTWVRSLPTAGILGQGVVAT